MTKDNNANPNANGNASAQQGNKAPAVPQHIAMESALGAALLLATKATTHKYLFAHDFEWLFIPAIATKQFALYRNKQGEPIAFVSWAKINEDIENRLLSGVLRLSPQDWNSGEKFYVIDVVSPFFPVQDILKQLANGQLRNNDANIVRPNSDGVMESVPLQQVIGELEQSKNQQQDQASAAN